MLFITEGISFILKKKLILRNWVIQTIESEGKKEGKICFVFCNDEYLLKMNNRYLHHDTYTDVITFDYSEGETISGDILISIERVKENAVKYKVKFDDELHKVMIHGVLHLLGYKDKTPGDITLMRLKEDYYLSLLTF